MLAGQPHQLVDGHGAGLSFHGHAIDLAKDEAVPGRRPGVLADQDRGAVDLVQAFQARRQVHPVAHRRVAQPIGRAEVPHQHPPGVQPEPRPPEGKGRRKPPGGFTERARRGRAPERRPTRRRGVRAQPLGGIPQDHEGVADVLVHGPPGRLDGLGGRLQIAPQRIGQPGRGQGFGVGREVGDVGEHQRHLGQLGAQPRVHAALVESAHQIDGDVLHHGPQRGLGALDTLEGAPDLDEEGPGPSGSGGLE